jgi:YlmC/YmxH family sporulation protein
MRLSEFAQKKIINVYNGEILGSAGESDLLIDPADGRILEIILQPPGRLINRADKHPVSIPWSAVKKVGPEIIVVDSEEGDIFRR